MLNEKITTDLFQHQLTFSSSEYSKLMDQQLFQINPAAFDIKLPRTTESNWELTLLGEFLESEKYTIEQLSEKNLQLKSIAIADQTYATFLNYVKDLANPEAYTVGLASFTSTIIDSAQVDIDDVRQKMPITDHVVQQLKEGIKTDVNQLFQSSIINPLGNKKNEDLKEKIAELLKLKGIPIDQKENSFYFSSTQNDLQWDVEIFIPENEQYINCYASFPFSIKETELAILLKNINDLNLAINTGSFQYNQSLALICFKSFSFITEKNLAQLLSDILTESEIKMCSILPFVDKLSIKN
jgi:hypothetical protein